MESNEHICYDLPASSVPTIAVIFSTGIGIASLMCLPFGISLSKVTGGLNIRIGSSILDVRAFVLNDLRFV